MNILPTDQARPLDPPALRPTIYARMLSPTFPMSRYPGFSCTCTRPDPLRAGSEGERGRARAGRLPPRNRGAGSGALPPASEHPARPGSWHPAARPLLPSLLPSLCSACASSEAPFSLHLSPFFLPSLYSTEPEERKGEANSRAGGEGTEGGECRGSKEAKSV
ncbi:hypothetical protein NUW54_g2631 [Trametes sanguinea]|uniref:Uncharacterized protein n=1 Tax=Trametes sanguinea TaxID=158606 RepID=A0ACC1Q657_9APHY|nr:hypothetical protein NUW54_g2631 [Trametes sanguinea]